MAFFFSLSNSKTDANQFQRGNEKDEWIWATGIEIKNVKFKVQRDKCISRIIYIALINLKSFLTDDDSVLCTF